MPQVVQHVRSARGGHVPKAVGAGRCQGQATGAQQGQGCGVLWHAHPHIASASSHAGGHQGRGWRHQRQGARPQGSSQGTKHCQLGWRQAQQGLCRGSAGSVHNQRVCQGAALDGEDGQHSRGVQGIGAQAIHCLCGKGHALARVQVGAGTREASCVRGQQGSQQGGGGRGGHGKGS